MENLQRGTASSPFQVVGQQPFRRRPLLLQVADPARSHDVVVGVGGCAASHAHHTPLRPPTGFNPGGSSSDGIFRRDPALWTGPGARPDDNRSAVSQCIQGVLNTWHRGPIDDCYSCLRGSHLAFRRATLVPPTLFMQAPGWHCTCLGYRWMIGLWARV